MKYIEFQKIKIQNFLSVGNKPIEIDFRTGLNIITGINSDREDSRNGCGKSSVLCALFFVLFGNPIKEIRKEQIVNNTNKKNCNVTLEFSVKENGIRNDYVLTRSIFPTKIKLSKDGGDITESSMPKTTQRIYDLIGSSPEVFANSVIMTIDNTIPFMAHGKVEKRKFIEGILKLNMFNDMLLLARQEANDTKKIYDIEATKESETTNSLEVYKQHKEDAERGRTDRIKVLENRSKDNTKEIEELQKKITKPQKKNLQKIENNIQLLKNKEAELRADIRKGVKQIATHEERIKNNLSTIKDIEKLEKEEVCYACLRPFEDKEDITFMEKKKTQILKRNSKLEENIKMSQKALDEYEAMQDKCLRGVDQQKTKFQELQKSIEENENIKLRLKQLNTWNKQITKDIEELNRDTNNFSKVIEETEAKLNQIQEGLKDIQKKVEVLDVVKFIVSEEGVKSYIVKKILHVLNNKLSYYLKKMDANCSCVFNEYFEEYIVNDKSQECSYHNFSSGERKRIDLAMLFTFMDIRRLQGDVSINLSMYDEILDTSLDDKGVDLFLEIVQERIEKYKEAVYIISHKDTAIKRATGEIIYLEKKNGFTHRIKPIEGEK